MVERFSGGLTTKNSLLYNAAIGNAHLDSHIDKPQDPPLMGEETTMAKRMKERIQVGTDANGTPIYQWVDGYSRTELLLNAAKALVASGLLEGQKPLASVGKHLFKACAERYMELYRDGGVGPTTFNNYNQQMKKHILPVFGEMFVEDVSWEDVQRFYNQKDNLNRESKRKLRTALNIVFVGAMKDGYIQKNPTELATIKGAPSTPRPILSVEQMEDIIAHIGDVEDESDRRYLALAAPHAMIPEEILGLKWEDIRLDRKQITIRRAVVHPDRNQPFVKTPKEDARTRTIGIVAGMEQYIASGTPRKGFVFGGDEPLSFTAFNRMMERIGKQVNLYGATTYSFRHTVLTDAYDATKDVKLIQAFAGHASPTMTMGRYARGRTKTEQVAQSIGSLYGCGKSCGKPEGPQTQQIQGFEGCQAG